MANGLDWKALPPRMAPIVLCAFLARRSSVICQGYFVQHPTRQCVVRRWSKKGQLPDAELYVHSLRQVIELVIFE